MTVDVVDRIDELIAGEKCPHCERDFHQGALTQRVAAMFAAGSLDSQYFAREDTSPIVCDGSTFIGPLRPDPPPLGYASGGFILSGFIEEPYTLQGLWDLKATTWKAPKYSYTYSFTLGINPWAPWITGWDKDWNKLWSTKPDLEPLEDICDDAPDITVEFGPQNWSIPTEPANASHQTRWLVSQRWNAFQRADTPLPIAPGYDLKPLAEKFNKQFTHYKEKKHEGIRAPRSC